MRDRVWGSDGLSLNPQMNLSYEPAMRLMEADAEAEAEGSGLRQQGVGDWPDLYKPSFKRNFAGFR